MLNLIKALRKVEIEDRIKLVNALCQKIVTGTDKDRPGKLKSLFQVCLHLCDLISESKLISYWFKFALHTSSIQTFSFGRYFLVRCTRSGNDAIYKRALRCLVLFSLVRVHSSALFILC